MHLPGQWWERMGDVLFLPPLWDPNDDQPHKGWVKVTPDRARLVLESKPK